MNDRFKFRVWDKRLNRYLGENDPTQMLLENGNLAYLDDEGMKFYEVKQCTGLKDKNGKLIYEGDIVECDEGIGKVFYSIPTASLGIEFSDYSIYGSNICHYDIDVIDCVIIGNIHENKELLDE